MKFNIVTIFPEIFNSYFNESILKRAQEKKIIEIKTHNLRDFTEDKHKKVDDSPYGGGPGMVLKIEPITRAVNSILKISNFKFKISKQKKTRVILFSTRGKKLDQKTIQRLAKYEQLILICGRYEGVDERVAKYIADEEISVGDFVLAGGELPAMILVETVARFVLGVLGKKESLETIKGSYPTYTRPEVFIPHPWKISASKKRKFSKGEGWRVPKILLSGDHKKIDEWRKKLGAVQKLKKVYTLN